MKAAVYESHYMMDKAFPVIFHRDVVKSLWTEKQAFFNHYHENLEFLFFIEGKAFVQCGLKRIKAGKNDIVIINNSESHYVEAITKATRYYCLIIDISMLQSRFADVCETKYITPVVENRIVFKNIIHNDSNAVSCFKNIIDEFAVKDYAFELSVKANLYNLFVILMRDYIKSRFNKKESQKRIKNQKRFGPVLKYIHENYMDNISIETLCEITRLSKYHFLRTFKEMNGFSPLNYINYVRINRAELLLLVSDMNITEIALECGFSDSNYFSRMFKKQNGISPTRFRNDKKA